MMAGKRSSRLFASASATMTVLLPLVLSISACGEGASSSGTTQSIADLIPYPSDPNTLVSYTVMGTDQSGNWHVASQGTITKGEQWRRMTTDAPAARTTSGDVETKVGAIQVEGCWHGSPIVLNDQPGFAGNYLCFDNNDGNTTNKLDIDTVASGFVMRSAYAVAPVLMFDSTPTLQIKWCTSNLQQVDPYTGPRIKYLQTGSTRTGICHF